LNTTHGAVTKDVLLAGKVTTIISRIYDFIFIYDSTTTKVTGPTKNSIGKKKATKTNHTPCPSIIFNSAGIWNDMICHEKGKESTICGSL
jgi:hypothetical protein